MKRLEFPTRIKGLQRNHHSPFGKALAQQIDSLPFAAGSGFEDKGIYVEIYEEKITLPMEQEVNRRMISLLSRWRKKGIVT